MYQAITDSQFGQQNAWSGRIDLNLFAQFVDDDPQVMRVIAVRAILNLLHDLLTRHNLAGFPRENLQHQISLSDRGQVFAVNRPGADGQIDFKAAGSDDGIVRRRGGGGPYMWKGAKVAAVLFLLAACAADEEQRRAQREEFAKAAAEAEAQIAQQDDARCKSYGRPGSAAYIDCRTSLKNDRADMKK